MTTPEFMAAISIVVFIMFLFAIVIGVGLNNTRKHNLHLKWVEKSIPIRNRFLETCDKVRVMTRWHGSKQVWFIQVAHVPHPQSYPYEYKTVYEPTIYWVNSSDEVFYTEAEAATVAKNMAYSYFEGTREVFAM